MDVCIEQQNKKLADFLEYQRDLRRIAQTKLNI